MPVPPVIQMYRYVMGSGGGLGNLLKASEEFQQTRDWVRYPTNSETPTVNDDSRPDPNGGTTADQVDYTANNSARLQQTVTLSASTEYTFSVHARAVSGSVDFKMRNITLKAAVQKTATTTGPLTNGFTRFTYTFTTGAAGSYELALQNASGNTARSVIFWGAMLNQGGTAAEYEYAAPTTGGSAPAPAYAGFGDAFGGVTAYYSLRQFTEAETLNAIRVRRSSDDTEQDIGFDSNGDLDSTALLAFVNEDITQYNYSTATQMVADFASVGGAESVDSVGGEEALKFTINASSGTHFPYRFNVFGGSGECSISFDYYLPSTNTDIDGIQMSDASNDIGATQTTQDAWTSVTVSGTLGGTAIYIFSKKGGTKSFTGNGTDVFYIKNLVVTQTTADGAVTTWYDQSGNGNDATNATESEQPLVVSGGTLVEENSKAAILGASKKLNVAAAAIQDTFDIFAICNIDDECYIADMRQGDVDGTMILGRRTTGWLYNGSTFLGSASSVSTATQILANFEISTTSATYHENGLSVETISHSVNTSANEGFRINFLSGNTLQIQELIVFNSDQSTNRTGIESNINDHFDIYT